MKVQYVGPSSGGVEVNGFTCPPGVVVDFPDDVAARLLEQNTWAVARPAKKGDDE